MHIGPEEYNGGLSAMIRSHLSFEDAWKNLREYARLQLEI